MRFAAVGFTCIDVYKNLNISYPTGNGIDLMFNLMDLVPELVPSVVTAIEMMPMDSLCWKRVRKGR